MERSYDILKWEGIAERIAISPLIFNVFIDDILRAIRSSSK